MRLLSHGDATGRSFVFVCPKCHLSRSRVFSTTKPLYRDGLRLWEGSTSALGGELLLHHLLWLTIWGRWDTPHALVDDPEEGEEPIWPGDADVQSSRYEQGADDIVENDYYSNAWITDFHTLAKPEEDAHDRARTPRMWHVGTSRDLTRRTQARRWSSNCRPAGSGSRSSLRGEVSST
jgi:hypothetical protein